MGKNQKLSHRGWRCAILVSLFLLASIAPASDDVRAWGRNDTGQLGIMGPDKSTPTTVPGLANVIAIKAGGAGGGGTGEGHSLALLSNGAVMSWGRNSEGEVGNGTTTQGAVWSPTGVINISNVSLIDAGPYNSYAVLTDGTLKSWGDNGLGQIGDGTQATRNAPVSVSGLTNVAAVTGGEYFTIALLQNGTVMAWGYNGSGELGIGTTVGSVTPVPINGLTNVKAIASGFDFSLALLSDGTVRAWGAKSPLGSGGCLGNGTSTGSSTPVTVTGLTNVIAIAAGGNANGEMGLALLRDGTVKVWGTGVLGNGSSSSLTPVPISGLANVSAIALGGGHALALLKDGTVRGWGSNLYGQIGDGTTTQRNTPVVIPGLSNVVAITAGHFHSLALTSTTGNLPPLITAGPDAAVVLPAMANLTGFARDDGLPNPPGALALTWSKVSGPGTVKFSIPSAAITTASFGQAGVYVLQLSGSDGALTSANSVTITCSGHQPGDINGDGVVNVSDLNEVISNFGKSYP